jgi:hypothetical protein
LVKKKIPKYSQLARLGIPALMIPGIIWASIYGTSYWKKITNYYQNSNLFPISGVVAQVEDGDTFTLTSGQKVRMTGINAPDKGKPGFDESKEFAQTNMEGKKVWLEYDRYQDDKYGRLLAWVWLNCETLSPKFLPATYMYVSKSESKEYLTQKPIGCQKGTLFNQTLVSQNQAEAIDYSGRGRLKYKL